MANNKKTECKIWMALENIKKQKGIKIAYQSIEKKAIGRRIRVVLGRVHWWKRKEATQKKTEKEGRGLEDWRWIWMVLAGIHRQQWQEAKTQNFEEKASN